MIDCTKKLPARFYVNAAGGPFATGFSNCPSPTVTSSARTFQKIEFGWPVGRPQCAPLGNGLWEVRSSLPSGRIARVIFCIGEGGMVLRHGFIKKTQKMPPADLDLALKRKKEVA